MRANFWKIGLVLFVCLAARLPALAPFTSDELDAPPSSARLAEIEHIAATSGWKGLIPALHKLAFYAYEHDSQSAEAWLLLSRWAETFATSDDEFMSHWIDAIKSANVYRDNLPVSLAVRKHLLSDHLSPALQAWVLGHADFTAQFFSLVSPCDLLPKSFDILSELQARDPEKFSTYASLALAIAVVYDVPPPPYWPHAQVNASALPRKLPDPAEAFAFWVRADESGQTLQPLSRLPASELKFVVDAAAPAAELEWAQQNISTPLDQFARIYNKVRYRMDRLQEGVYNWPEASYELPAILRAGGICVDQAYFSSEVGKAKGVPTLLFAGAGRDSWHAWFGYLDENRQWQLDGGRGADVRQFVTGVAFDPQTWEPVSDHELKFLSEGFRLRQSWRQACANADFAAAYLAAGQFAAAARAARVAVNYEPRHFAAWETLLAAQKRLGTAPTEIEATLREAKLAFQNYPDIEASFTRLIADSMRARGEGSAADFAESQFAHKVGWERDDLNISHAAAILAHSVATDDIDAQIHTYYSVCNAYGRGTGMEFFSRIVAPFVVHLQKARRPDDAVRAAQFAQGVLLIDPHSQLDGEMHGLLAWLRAGSQN
jgi:hypothetical protein